MIELTLLDGQHDVELVMEPELPLEADEADAVDALWREHRERHPSAFDGLVVGLEEVRASAVGSVLVGRPARYRRWIAQRLRPGRPGRELRPLAVTGLLRVEGGIVLGRRPDDAAQDAGRWELAPAGILDVPADGEPSVRRQLEEELLEELGLPWPSVRAARPWALALDPRTGVTDVVVQLVLDLSFAEVEAHFARRRSDEYVDLRRVEADALAAFVEDAGDTLAPVSHALLTRLELPG